MTAPDTSAEVERFSDDYVSFLAGLGGSRCRLTADDERLSHEVGEVPVMAAELLALRARVDELEAERSEPAHVVVQMAYERGAEAMRERAAQVLDEMAALDAERMAEDVRIGDERGATFWRGRVLRYETAAKRIRALPLDADASEDDAPNLCPGCHSAPGEPHPPYCPDADEESDREESDR